MKDAQIEHEWRSLSWTIMFFPRCHNNFYLICVYTEMGISTWAKNIWENFLWMVEGFLGNSSKTNWPQPSTLLAIIFSYGLAWGGYLYLTFDIVNRKTERRTDRQLWEKGRSKTETKIKRRIPFVLSYCFNICLTVISIRKLSALENEEEHLLYW